METTEFRLVYLFTPRPFLSWRVNKIITHYTFFSLWIRSQPMPLTTLTSWWPIWRHSLFLPLYWPPDTCHWGSSGRWKLDPGSPPSPVSERFGERIPILLQLPKLCRQPPPHHPAWPVMDIRKLVLFPRTTSPVSKCGFINQASVWNVLIERAMPGLCMSPESFKELWLTFEASKSPLEKWPGTLFGHMAHSSLSRTGNYWKARTERD